MSGLRVLQVDAGREWRGGQNQVRLLGVALARLPEVTQSLVTRAASPLAQRATAAGVDVRGVPWGPAFDPRALIGLTREIARLRPDVLHAHDAHALVVASWARRLSGSRAALVAHRRVDFHVRRGSEWFAADRIVAISEAVRAVLMEDGIPETRIAVVASGVDAEEVRAIPPAVPPWRERLGLGPGTPLAVNVAALVPHKDHLTLVRAAAAARAQAPELHWVVAGEGEQRATIEGEIARLALSDRVRLLGFVADAPALVREADVVVMSSSEEGLGSAILEALALGRPVVATRGGGIPEILPADRLAAVGDGEGLARRVLEVLAGGDPVSLPDRFTAAAMAAGVLAVYRAVVPARPAPVGSHA